MFKQSYLLLSALKYAMKDEETGAMIEGISVWYVMNDHLNPVEDEEALKRGQISRGMTPAKMSLPLSCEKNLNVFPGLYEVTMEMATVKNKQMIRPRDISFVSPVKLVAEKPPVK